MTEGTSPPSGPGQEPGETSSPKPTTTDQDAKVGNPDQPSAQAQERAKSRRGRSNEFWLALAGIAATVAVGVTGSWLTYQASTHQVKAEADRTALAFSKQQRKDAYADFLNAVADLDRAEYKVAYPAESELQQPESQFSVYTAAEDKFNRAGSTVRASREVAKAREAIRDEHARIYAQIESLKAAAKGGAPPDILIERLRLNMGLNPSRDLEQHFIDAAKRDLGVSD